jgi:nucleotide-binding universal stress UspA family protein
MAMADFVGKNCRESASHLTCINRRQRRPPMMKQALVTLNTVKLVHESAAILRSLTVRSHPSLSGAATMYKRILLPTDGSAASARAVDAGVAFAKELGAEVIGLTVTPEFHTFTYQREMLADTPEVFAQNSRLRAQHLLQSAAGVADDAGVGFRGLHAVSDNPYDAILSTADAQQCDLIVMASHGQRGIKGLLLGSETQKVLVHGRIPVLVYR